MPSGAPYRQTATARPPGASSKKKQVNDADRIRKYLASFGLAWAEVVEEAGSR
jgi:sigma54-dependent transcription regulator